MEGVSCLSGAAQLPTSWAVLCVQGHRSHCRAEKGKRATKPPLTVKQAAGMCCCGAWRSFHISSLHISSPMPSQFPFDIAVSPKTGEQTQAFCPALSVCLASESHYRIRAFSSSAPRGAFSLCTASASTTSALKLVPLLGS